MKKYHLKFDFHSYDLVSVYNEGIVIFTLTSSLTPKCTLVISNILGGKRRGREGGKRRGREGGKRRGREGGRGREGMGKENREGREGWVVEWEWGERREREGWLSGNGEREQEGKDTNTLSCAARGKCLGTRLVGRGEWEGGGARGMRRVGRRGEREARRRVERRKKE